MARLFQMQMMVVTCILFGCLNYPNVFAIPTKTTSKTFPRTGPPPPSSSTTTTSQHRLQQIKQQQQYQKTSSASISYIGRTATHSVSKTTTRLSMMPSTDTTVTTSTTLLSSLSSQLFDPLTKALTMTPDQAETIAGPLFGASLFPYLAFLYFLSRPTALEPDVSPGKGVTVGFATCLLFVFLTIPAAIAAKMLYGVSLADSDWLHGSAESLLTLTNLVTVVAFRQALQGKERRQAPASTTSYNPMVTLVVVGTLVAALTAMVPAVASGTTVHTPYLYGVLDLPASAPPQLQPANALSVACWIIHISSLVEFLVAMGFCWRWGEITGRSQWKGLTWGLLPLHSSGITACTYHLFYNQIAVLVPFQALLTVVGNTTAAYAAWRIARASGWNVSSTLSSLVTSTGGLWPEEWKFWSDEVTQAQFHEQQQDQKDPRDNIGKQGVVDDDDDDDDEGLIGFEDLGQALAADTDFSFLMKLFIGSAVASYVIKYGEVLLARDFFYHDSSVYAALSFILIPSALNAYKWNQRSKDPTFEGWF